MLQNLPSEILLEVCSHLSIRDIVHLQRCSRSLKRFVKHNENYIISNQFQNDLGTNKNYMYGALTYIITDTYKKASGSILWQFSNSGGYKLPVKEIRWIVLQHIDLIRVCNNELINYMFRKVFHWYYTTPHTVSNSFSPVAIWSYPNKLELYTLYRFLLISCFRSQVYSPVDSNINFLDTFVNNTCTNHHVYQIGVDYFKHVLENKIDVRFDSLFKMSKCVVTLPMIKRLFGCRKLNLDYSLLSSCCDECNSDALKEILAFKTNRPDDYFLSQNYKTIKAFLIKNKPDLYRNLTNLENSFINARIFYRHPNTRRRVRLDSNVSCRLLYKYHYQYGLLYNSFGWNDRVYHEYNSLQRYIFKRRTQLFLEYFS